MNFLIRIKELKKEAKKIKLRELPKWAIALPFIPFLQIPLILEAINGMVTAKTPARFSFETFFMASFSLLILISIWMVYEVIKDLKQYKMRIKDKDINDFILTFPEEYREIVIKNISIYSGKKKYFSLTDLKVLEKSLTFEKLKSDMENVEFMNTLSGNKNEMINLTNDKKDVKKIHELY